MATFFCWLALVVLIWNSAPSRIAVRTKATPVDAPVVAILAHGLPGDDETAIGQRRNPGVLLGVRYLLVHLEFELDRVASTVKALAKDAKIVTILVHGLPDDHESTIVECGDLWIPLCVRSSWC